MTCFGLLQSLHGWAHARENFNGLELTVGIFRTSPSLSVLSPLGLLGFCPPLHWGTQPAQARVFSVATERRPLVQKLPQEWRRGKPPGHPAPPRCPERGEPAGQSPPATGAHAPPRAHTLRSPLSVQSQAFFKRKRTL